MKTAGKSDTGLVRQANQDAYHITQFSGKITLGAVCDGMGGPKGGEVAAETALRIIVDQISSSYRPDMSARSAKNMLKSAVFAANITVHDMAKAAPSLDGMGTTVVIVYAADGTAHIAHVGDSRVYLINSDKTEITQITKDHSIVQNMLESGQLTREEAKHHPRRNIITRAIGVGETVEMDYAEVPLSRNDILLLCTDGLSNHLDSDDILLIIRENEFSEIPEKLIELANKRGGSDNITAVLIENE